MQHNNLTADQAREFKIDLRNMRPFKVVASGCDTPQRFTTEKEARTFLNQHQGTALLSYNTNTRVKILAYKYA